VVFARAFWERDLGVVTEVTSLSRRTGSLRAGRPLRGGYTGFSRSSRYVDMDLLGDSRADLAKLKTHHEVVAVRVGRFLCVGLGKTEVFGYTQGLLR